MLKLALRYGLTAQDLSRALLRAGIEFYEKETSAVHQSPPSPSRLAKYTGLTQTELGVFRDDIERAKRSRPLHAELLSAVLSSWHSDSKYSAVYGIALDLPFHAEEGRKRSFSELVSRVAPEEDAREVLAVLLASNCVSRLPNGDVRALTQSYVLPEGDVSRLHWVGKSLRTHGDVLARNIMSNEPPSKGLFERTLVSDMPMDRDQMDEFHAEVRRSGSKYLAELDSNLSSRARRTGSWRGTRCGVGFYYFEDSFFDDLKSLASADFGGSAAADPVNASKSEVGTAPGRSTEEIDVLQPASPEKGSKEKQQ